VHVEVKMQGAIRILEWLRQAEEEAPEGCAPAVHFRLSSRSKSTGWYVALPLDYFIDMVKRQQL
jgi:hypothetical protein